MGEVITSRKRQPRDDKVRAQDAARQREATKRKKEREARLGARTIKGEIYRATSEALERIAAAAGCEEEIEVLANAAMRLDELRQRDPHAFACLTSHENLPEVWHG